MKKIILLLTPILFVSTNLLSADKDYSFSYFEISANYNEDISYEGELSLNLPSLPIYLKGILNEQKTESQGIDFDKSSNTVALGVHGSLSDIFGSVSGGGITLNLKKVFELYGELGLNEWELKDNNNNIEDGNNAYLRAGIKLGDSSAWEYDIFFQKTKIADILKDPATGKYSYSLSEETNDKMGVNVVNHFSDKISYTLGFENDDFSGASFSLGLRYSF